MDFESALIKVKQIVNGFQRRIPYKNDEFLEEAYIALMQVYAEMPVQSQEPNYKFEAHLYVKIRQRIFKFNAENKTVRVPYSSQNFSYNFKFVPLTGQLCSKHNGFNACDCKDLLEIRLDEEEKQVANMLLANYKIDEITKELNISKNKLYRIKSTIQQKLKNEIQ